MPGPRKTHHNPHTPPRMPIPKALHAQGIRCVPYGETVIHRISQHCNLWTASGLTVCINWVASSLLFCFSACKYLLCKKKQQFLAAWLNFWTKKNTLADDNERVLLVSPRPIPIPHLGQSRRVLPKKNDFWKIIYKSKKHSFWLFFDIFKRQGYGQGIPKCAQPSDQNFFCDFFPDFFPKELCFFMFSEKHNIQELILGCFHKLKSKRKLLNTEGEEKSLFGKFKHRTAHQFCKRMFFWCAKKMLSHECQGP